MEPRVGCIVAHLKDMVTEVHVDDRLSAILSDKPFWDFAQRCWVFVHWTRTGMKPGAKYFEWVRFTMKPWTARIRCNDVHFPRNGVEFPLGLNSVREIWRKERSASHVASHVMLASGMDVAKTRSNQLFDLLWEDSSFDMRCTYEHWSP